MASERLKVVEDEGGDEETAVGSENVLTVEQLAAETGQSVRNIRAHQARGLLPAPEVRQRIGYYGPGHVARLRLIQELQGDGFNLKGIERLIEDSSPAASEAMLSFRRVLSEPFESELPEIVTIKELRERFGGAVSPKNLSRVIKMGILVPVGATKYELPSPRLIEIAEEVLARGIELEAALDVIEVVQRSSRYAAEAFTELFLKGIWQPFEADGRPDERWQEVIESIERLRPIASQALVSMFEMTMTGQVERAFGDELSRQAGEKPSERKRRRG
jgi:DNA-binding transcriptional MerR regulator